MKAYIKREKIIKFGDTEIEKQTYQQHKEPISIKTIDIHRKAKSNKACLGKKGFKYFIGYINTNFHNNEIPKEETFFLFLEKEKEKGRKNPQERYKNLTDEEK